MSHIKDRLSDYHDFMKKLADDHQMVLAIDVLEMLEQLQDDLEQDEKENGWIPVSERLPEETGEYLVWYDCGDEEGCMVVNFDAGIGSFGDWYDDYDNITLGFVDSEFIYFETAVAWMPLLEPYKEDEP